MTKIAAASLALLSLVLVAPAAQAAVPLPAYNVDTSQITVSGLSSGGFMANQLGYAYSATFKGVGVFAGGPYMCAGHSNYTACMYNATIGASMLNTMQADINNWSGTAIDAKVNVAAQKVYLFAGSSDRRPEPDERAAHAVRQQRRAFGEPRVRAARRYRACLPDRLRQQRQQRLQQQHLALHRQLRL